MANVKATDLIDFTRASTGTYLDSDGTLKTAANNIPRIEYDADGNLLGLLVEEARTNYNSDSKITSSGWTTVRSSLDRSEGVLFLDGTVATRLKEDSSASNTHHTQDINSLGSSSATFVFSIFAKKPDENSRPYVQLRVSDDPAGANKIYSVLFDLSDGSFLDDGSTGSPSNTFYGSEQYPDGWWRFWCGFTKGGTATRTDTQICLSDTATITAFGNIDTYSGDGVSGLYVAGAQLEQGGSFPTSYIKTSGSTASRSADVASIDVDQFGYNQSEGTVVVEATNISDNAFGPYLSDGTSSERIFVYINGGYQLLIADGGTTVAQIDGGNLDSGANKISAAYKLNDSAVSLNGGSVVTDTSCTMPTVTKMNIGTDFNGSTSKAGHIKSINYYPKRLSNAKLQELTS